MIAPAATTSTRSGNLSYAYQTNVAVARHPSCRSAVSTHTLARRQLLPARGRVQIDPHIGQIGSVDCSRQVKEDRQVETTVVARSFEEAGGNLTGWFTERLRAAILANGYRLVDDDEPSDEGGIVLHPVGGEGPRSFRRKNRAVRTKVMMRPSLPGSSSVLRHWRPRISLSKTNSSLIYPRTSGKAMR
jgi:hypothetical protein